MKVRKSEAIVKVIAILDLIFDDEDKSVSAIQQELLKLKDGENKSPSDVDKIFGKWANITPNPKDPRHVVEFICAYIKHEMFR